MRWTRFSLNDPTPTEVWLESLLPLKDAAKHAIASVARADHRVDRS